MKTLSYRCAVVSFCPDLTSATSESMPLACLLVGELGDEPVAALAWLQVPEGVFGADRLAAAIMHDLPAVLHGRIEEAWTNLVDRNLDATSVLAELHHSLRTTLHVSDISAVVQQSVSEAREVPGILVGVVIRQLVDVSQRNVIAHHESGPTLPAAALPEEEHDQPARVGADYFKMKRRQQKPVVESHASAE